MYSIIESSKLNGLNSYPYLRFLFLKLPESDINRDEIQKILPCFVTADKIKITD